MSSPWIDSALTWLASVNWGDMPTWLSALVSGAALFAAVAAARAARDTWTLEQNRDLAREAAEVAAQASLIAAYPGKNPAKGYGPPFTTPEGFPDRLVTEYTAPAVIIRNASTLPVYDIQVEDPPRRSQTGPGALKHGLIPPGVDHAVNLLYTDIAPSLHTKELKEWARETPFAEDYDEHTADAHEEWLSVGRPAISFTDANGQRWRRDKYGQLSKSDPLPGRTGPQAAPVKQPTRKLKTRRSPGT